MLVMQNDIKEWEMPWSKICIRKICATKHIAINKVDSEKKQ